MSHGKLKVVVGIVECVGKFWYCWVCRKVLVLLSV